MKQSTLQYLCPILILLLCAGGLHADRIILKNGRKIDGTLVGQSRNYIRVRSNGRVIRIQKRRIRRILYGNFAPPTRKTPVTKPVKKPPVAKKPPPARKPPVAKKPPPAEKPAAKVDKEKLREAAEKLRAAEERVREAEKRIREAEEKIKAANLKARTAEAKRLEATALAREWELKARKGSLKGAFARGKSAGPSFYDYFVPGLGQWRRDDNLNAGLTGGFFLLNAFNLYDGNEKWKQERTAYENLNSFGTPSPTATSDPGVAYAYAQVFESRQANIDAQYARTRNAFIGLLLVYAWNYFDLKGFRTESSGKSPGRSAYGRWRVDLTADAGASSRTTFQDLGGSAKDSAGIRFFFSAKIF